MSRLQKRATRNPSVKCTFVFPDTHFQAPLDKAGTMLAPDYCHDPDALSVALQIAKDRKPDEIIHLGDICEMGTISRWSKLAGRESQVQGRDKRWYESAWNPQMKMVEAFWEFMADEFPKAEKTQLEGNHDYWAFREFARPPLSQFADRSLRNLPLWKDANIKYHPYDGGDTLPYADVGRVRVIHGYNATAERMRKEHDNVIYGDSHQIIYKQWDANSRESRAAWCVGCLSKLKPEFNSLGGRQNGWRHGFGVIYTMPDGGFQVDQVRIDNGRCINFDGKSYYGRKLSSLSRTLESLTLC